MQFKDLQKSYQVYILYKGEKIRHKMGTVVSIANPRINATYRFFKVGDLLVTTLVNGKDGVQILDYLLAIFQYGLVLVHAIQNVITISHDGVDLVKDRVPVTRYGNVISNFYRHVLPHHER